MYYIKIFGIQRTCTNYFEHLHLLNFNVKPYKLDAPLGWKHSFVDDKENLVDWGLMEFYGYKNKTRNKRFIHSG